jgi:hypothetical protein
MIKFKKKSKKLKNYIYIFFFLKKRGGGGLPWPLGGGFGQVANSRLE